MVCVWCVEGRLRTLTFALCFMLTFSPGHAYIYVHLNNMSSMMLEDWPALFGSPLPRDGLMGILVESRPLNACAPIDPPPVPPTSSDPNSTIGFVVLIRRYDCNFDTKASVALLKRHSMFLSHVLHAQQAGYSAAIVHNVYSDVLLSMNYSNETIADEIEIPSVFTSYSASKILHSFIKPDRGAYVILKPDFSFPITFYLIPFTGIVGLIIIVMVVILVVRCVQYRKRLRKNRLTKEQLKKIPIHKFTKAYHSRCVDPWLTQTKKTCPVCKQRVTRTNPEYSDSSDSEEEAGPHTGDDGEGGASGEEQSERTPLLHPSPPSSGTYEATVATVMTSAQCLPQRDSPLLGYDGYYSPMEGSEEDTEETEDDDDDDDDDDTAQLIGRGPVRV
ncbi:hypothetical protein PDJAM_G00164160 [Pangasius djambal]|uniref:Uncharacterized protein n=1 Tax=Pangasius djambal TaxID=1691987 RepID=A0ACC5ZK01_9TELE|nr:hypothetical protein [Pangasius djambal]